MRERELDLTRTSFLVAAMRGSDNITQVFDQYVSTLYSEHENLSERREQAMRAELARMAKVDWSKVFRASEDKASPQAQEQALLQLQALKGS